MNILYIDIYTVHHSMLINISQVISLHVYIQANLLCVLFSGNNVMGRSIVLYSTFSVLSIRISETTWTKRVAGSSIQRGKGDQVNIPQLEEIRGRYREETASVSDSLKIFVKKARRGWQYVGTARKSFTNKNVVWNTSVQRRWDPWSLYVPLANSEPCHKWASVTTADRTHCPERPSSNWDHQAEQTKNWQQALDNKFGRIKWIKWITYESHMNQIDSSNIFNIFQGTQLSFRNTLPFNAKGQDGGRSDHAETSETHVLPSLVHSGQGWSSTFLRTKQQTKSVHPIARTRGNITQPNFKLGQFAVGSLPFPATNSEIMWNP